LDETLTLYYLSCTFENRVLWNLLLLKCLLIDIDGMICSSVYHIDFMTLCE
jgi:hypothetical protein